MHFFDLCLACQNAPNTQTQTFMLWIKNQHWCVHGTCGTSQKWTSASASWMVIVVILFLFFAIVAIHACHVWLSDLRVKNLKWYLFRSLDEDGNIGRWALGHTTVYRWKDQTFCMLVNHCFFCILVKGAPWDPIHAIIMYEVWWSMCVFDCFSTSLAKNISTVGGRPHHVGATHGGHLGHPRALQSSHSWGHEELGERIRMKENVMVCHCPWSAGVYSLFRRCQLLESDVWIDINLNSLNPFCWFAFGIKKLKTLSKFLSVYTS